MIQTIEDHSEAPKTASRKGGCTLCGLSTGRSRIEAIVEGEAKRFCCPGCLHVFQILFNSPDGRPENFRETEIYRRCVEAGLIPSGEPVADPVSSSHPKPPHPDEAIAQELTVNVEGMWCSACSWLIDEVVGKCPGVLGVKVHFLSDMAHVKYLPHKVAPAEILEAIARLGYRASLFEEGKEAASMRRDLLVRLGVSGILSMNVMMISFALYFGFFQDLGEEGIRTFSYPLWLLATPVVFYGGHPIFRRALQSLRHGSVPMDVLIAVGTLAAYGYSVVRMLQGSLHLYFDTAAMLVTLVLLGRYIEMQARERISTGLIELYRMANAKVRLHDTEGRERWVSSESVQPGTEFVVSTGERIPIDGRILSGRSMVDESILTGESRPVARAAGEDVLGGGLVLEGNLRLRATCLGSESAISRMASLMREALERKNPVEILADRITRWFVPVILLLAASTAWVLIVRGVTLDEAILRAVTVLVITCPCALGIATPLAKVASIGAGRSVGLLVRDSSALERAKDLDVIIFDKTGTLTQGSFELRAVEGIDEALRLAACVEAGSDHFLAREIARKARERWPSIEQAESVETFEGLGVRGVVGSRTVSVGNRRFMASLGIGLSPETDRRGAELEADGSTVVFLAVGDRAETLLAFGDALKPDALETVSELRRRGITVWLVSGDSLETTRSIAERLGIDRFVGQTLPHEKVEIVRGLQAKGHRVGMFGDGVNDAAALAQADVGFAAGAGSNILHEASDITILSGSPGMVLKGLELSALACRTIRRNLFFAFFYNVLGIPLAVAGMLNPLLAVIAMLASSLTVIGNTLRISRFHKL